MRAIICLAGLACLAHLAAAQEAPEQPIPAQPMAVQPVIQLPIIDRSKTEFSMAEPATTDAPMADQAPAAMKDPVILDSNPDTLRALALIELLSAQSLSCEFGPISMVNWNESEPQPVTPNWTWEKLNYSAISIRDGTAEGGDPWVTGDVSIIPTNRGIHFYQIDSEGSLSIATVSTSLGADGRNQAVLSRHISNPEGPNPAQSYGFCRNPSAGDAG